MNATVEIDIQDAYNGMHLKEQKEFLLHNINDLDVTEIFEAIGRDRIITCLQYEGFTVAEE